MEKKIFSDYELLEIGIKFEGTTSYESAECIGSGEDAADAKVITKKCRGVVRKKRVKGTGTGVHKISIHCPWNIYTKMFGMEFDTLKDGVYAYGENSRHTPFSMTQKIKDEDGNEKLKAYPNCIIETGKAVKIENGAEDVAEIELEISYMPDEYGHGSYECIVSEVTEETVVSQWMSAFEPSLVQIETA